MLNYRKIEKGDYKKIAQIIRANLEKFHLDIPGTVYFDPELDRLSEFYNSAPGKRVYYWVRTGTLSAASAPPSSPGYPTALSFRSCI